MSSANYSPFFILLLEYWSLGFSMIFLRGTRGTSQSQLTPTQGAVAKSWAVWGAEGCTAPLSVCSSSCKSSMFNPHYWLMPSAFHTGSISPRHFCSRGIYLHTWERYIYTDILKVKAKIKIVLFPHTLIKMKCENAAYMQVCNYCSWAKLKCQPAT